MNAANTAYVLEGSHSMQLSHFLTLEEHHPLWISRYIPEQPGAIKCMHRDYLFAGSDILTTVTRNASIDTLMKEFNFDFATARAAIFDTVQIARDAWTDYSTEIHPPHGHLISGGIGAYGAVLGHPTPGSVDQVTEEFLMTWHRPRMEALREAGVDFFSFQSISSTKEALALLKILREYPHFRCLITIFCQMPELTASGEKLADVIRTVWQQGKQQILGVGVDCIEPDLVSETLLMVNNVIREPVPLIVCCSNGDIYDMRTGVWRGAASSLEMIPEWFNLGARFIGGCCRTNALHIQKIRTAVDIFNRNSHRGPQ